MGTKTVKQIAESYAVAAPFSDTVKGGGALSHDGSRAWSYRACIARKTGDRHAEVTRIKYSVTTSRHVSLIKNALLAAGFTLTETDL